MSRPQEHLGEGRAARRECRQVSRQRCVHRRPIRDDLWQCLCWRLRQRQPQQRRWKIEVGGVDNALLFDTWTVRDLVTGRESKGIQWKRNGRSLFSRVRRRWSGWAPWLSTFVPSGFGWRRYAGPVVRAVLYVDVVSGRAR